MARKLSFLERNDTLHKRFGHLTEGVVSKITGKEVSVIEQNKMEMLMHNLMEERCSELEVDYDTIDIAILQEQTANTGIVHVVKTDLAMINKIFPNLLLNQIASIQTLSDSVENIFYTDIVRDSDGTSVSTGIDAGKDYADNVEYNPSAPQAIASISFKLTKAIIETTEKKLKAQITIEVLQDLRKRHGKNADSIMTNNLAAETTREWDRMGIEAMKAGATGGSATFSMSEPAGIGYEERKYWRETLFDALVDVDNAIFKKRFRKTNFIVCDADVAAFIEKMQGFKAADNDYSLQSISTGGRHFSGSLRKRWNVFVDPLATDGKILMGYNNPNKWEETAFVFAPYILAYLSPWFVNPDTLVQTRAILSRAGMKVVVGDLLGIVTVTSS